MKQSQLNKDLKADSKYFDFMTLLFLIGYLLIDFMPYFQRTEIIKPQFLYLTVLNIVVGLYIYRNPKLHDHALITIFKKSYIFKAYLGFIVLATLSIVTARNLSLGINAITEILVVLSMLINFSILLYKRLYLLFTLCFIIGLSAFLQSLQALSAFKSLLTGHSIFKAAQFVSYLEGNTGNINIFSMSLMVKLPFLFIGIMHFNNWKRWLLMIALLLSSTIVYLISARASLLALVLIVLVFIAFYAYQNGLKRIHIIKLSYVLIPLLVSFALVNYIFSNNNQNGRYGNTISRLKQIKVGESTTNVRLDYYRAAIDFTLENPLLGIGLGNWRVESIPKETLRNGIVSLHTHNDFLELFAETGVVGGLFYLLIFIALFWVTIKRLTKRQEDHTAALHILTFMLLLVYGIDALFNFPFYRPTMQLFFCLLIALILVSTDAKDEVMTQLKKWQLVLILVLLPVIPLYFTYHADQTSQLEFKIAADNINFNDKGKLGGDDVVNQKPLFPNVLTSSESFDEYAGIYFFRAKQYDKAIKYLDKGNKINPYLGRPDFYKHLVANERGMSDSAAYYAKASFEHYPVNPVFFTASVRDKNYSDTLTVLNRYKQSAVYKKNAVMWNSAVEALKDRNYSKGNLHQFLKEGLTTFPKDSTVKQTYTSTLITEHIINGQVLFAAGKYKEALGAYTKALAVDQSDVYALQNIGFYYFNLNQSKEAIPYLLKALQKPGLNGGKTEYYLALCYLNIKDKVNACKYLNTANEQGYAAALAALKQHCGMSL